MQLIAKIKFGSHLYGTNTKESDTDFKGIFLPDKKEFILDTWNRKSVQMGTKTLKVEGQKNTKDDVDFEVYSLHYFLKLALEGQTVAIDMLHAPKNMIEVTSPIWEELQQNRHRFYTKNLESFVEYSLNQASKYGIKGSRLSVAKEVLNILNKYDLNTKLKDLWELLPVTEHSRFVESSPNNIRQYLICDKILQETITVKNAVFIINKFISVYGDRARQAEENKNIDFKAVSHALRAAYQVKHILLDKDIIFPLREAHFLLKVKQGKLDYTSVVAPKLENIIDEVKFLSKYSTFPEKADYDFYENFLIKVFNEKVFGV